MHYGRVHPEQISGNEEGNDRAEHALPNYSAAPRFSDPSAFSANQINDDEEGPDSAIKYGESGGARLVRHERWHTLTRVSDTREEGAVTPKLHLFELWSAFVCVELNDHKIQS